MLWLAALFTGIGLWPDSSGDVRRWLRNLARP